MTLTINLPPALRLFLKRYGRWILVLAVLDIGLWLSFELFGPQLTDNVDRWTLRLSLLSALLWLTNLFVLWWYAHRTEQQYGLALSLRREANKPIAVIDRKRILASDATGPEQARYVVRNIGPGLAVNVFHVTRTVEQRVGGPFTGPIEIKPIGALEAHGERILPETLEQSLRDARGHSKQVVIVAEGLVTRTARWTVAANALGPTGEVMHRFVALPDPQERDRLSEWLEQHWELLRLELAAAEHEARK